MTRNEHLLEILGEECNEVAQRCSKANRFGLHEVQPGQQLDNSERIVYELHDLMGAIEKAVEAGLIAYPNNRLAIEMKKVKIEEMLLFSKQKGTLYE